MSQRKTYRFYDYHAHCDDCGWDSWAKNAQGNAAKHSDKYGHTVQVEVTGGITYTPAGSIWEVSKLASAAERAARA